MAKLHFDPRACLAVTISLFLFLPACGHGKPAPTSPIPVKILLNPGTSYSMQAGSIVGIIATAINASGVQVLPAFTFMSTNPNVVDIAPNGAACAGTWNAPTYSVCTPAGTGVAVVTASALGSTSPPTYIFVHQPIDNIKISIVPPVNSPPPACPNQTALPEACNIPFNSKASNYCLSQNQVQTLQATAYSQGVDITSSVGPFNWAEAVPSVTLITPIVTVTSYNFATNQANVTPGTPGQTQVVASASGAFSQPFTVSTCNVQCIALEVGANGLQQNGPTNFVVNKGTSETITATAVDVQGCIVPKPPLTWVSSSPAALVAGSAASGCSAGTTCVVTTPQAGTATITASCSPPTCNIGYPLNPAGFPAPYIPEPVYPVTAISGLATGTPTSTNVLASSQDCYSNPLCGVGFYNVPTSTTISGGAIELPTPPNSLLFDGAGDKAYMGGEFGGVAINPGVIGTGNPFTLLPAPYTTTGLVTGKVLAVSPNGGSAIYSDTVSTPNQVYVVNTALSTPSSTPLAIDSAVAAAFSRDGVEAFILGNSGTTLYIYSTLQTLQPPVTLPTPATSMVFNSSGTFALFSGGAVAGSLAAYNTCDNSAITGLSSGTMPGPPLFLKMVPAVDIPQGNPNGNQFGSTIIPNLEPTGLDFFLGLDSTGINVIATNSSLAPLAELCPQQVVVAHTPANAPFPPAYINLNQGTFHPINFFLSPDATQAYIVTTDLGVLVYNFNTRAVTGIKLINNASPIAADITADGSLIYVAGSDGLLHQLNTALAIDLNQISFSPLPNQSNSFCFTGNNCSLNMVNVKP